MEKVWDEDYYILTLSALAKGLKERGLLKNKEVTFRCNDTRYHVKIEDVEVYAQGFAAVAAELPSYQGFNIVAEKTEGEWHIAAAILAGCDFIISWSFKYIVNVKTIRGIKAITTYEGYKDLMIYPPPALLEEEDEDYGSDDEGT